MIDSVLKGTGNSRFLKSAVPAGTSWADALAMLQAGTFPIDFNGINTEGFQQVGTPLNKANLLKDATAAQIGLPPSTTPDGMFQALGNTGELHVWRKTVTNQQAGYDLSDVKTNGTLANGDTGYARAALSYGSSVSVSSDGYVTIENQTNQQFYAAQSSNWPSLSGKFIKITDYAGDSSGSQSSANSDFQVGTVLHIPSGGNIAHDGSGRIYLTKYQIVTGYGAGTTTTYPVSTNPNAYQESDDVKPAGYTLGEVVSGNFPLSYDVGTTAQGSKYYVYNTMVNITDDGVVSVANPIGIYISNAAQSNITNAQVLKGKFIERREENGTIFKQNVVYYIPEDAVISGDANTSDTIYVDRYQPVIGYAAIPAGTTIEYLGKLGDKARVQVVSYVGTGTYGESNPCSITADFKIKVAIYLKSEDWYRSSSKWVEIADDLKTQYQQQHGFVYGKVSNAWGKRSSDSKTITWYNTYSNSAQLNASGVKYTFLIIG